MSHNLLKYMGSCCLIPLLAVLSVPVVLPSYSAALAADSATSSHAKPDINDSGDAEPKATVVGTAPAQAPVAQATHAKPSANANDSFGRYLSGRFAEEQGDTGKGIPFLRESLKHDPNNKEILASLYRMLVLAGNVDEAMPLASKLETTKVVEEGSEFSPAMLLAVEDVKHERYAQASKRLDAIHKAGFNSLLVPLLQAWLKYGQQQIAAPLEAKDIMPDAHIILPHVYLNTALINDLSGYDAQAQKQYESAVKDVRIEPFRAVEALANYYTRKDMKQKREQVVNDYLSAHGDSFLADELLNDTGQSKKLVTNATEGVAEVFYTMANIFHGVRAPADEIATLHLALYLRPDFPSAQFLLANTYELAQDFHSAAETYKSINTKSPYFERGRIRSVYDESELGNKEEALAKLDTIAREKPHDVDALLAKGDILRASNRFKEAEAVYSEASDRVGSAPSKRHWIIFFSRGTCYERLGQWDKAEADMKKALALNPGEPDVLNYLGYSWLTLHVHLAEAKKMIEEAYDARPEDAHIIDSMGYSFYVSGDFSSAQEYFEQALERTPNDPTVNDHLGDTYWQQGRKTEARFQWERALGDDPDADTEKSLKTKLAKGLAAIHPIQAVEEKKPAATPAAPAVE